MSYTDGGWKVKVIPNLLGFFVQAFGRGNSEKKHITTIPDQNRHIDFNIDSVEEHISFLL